MILDFFVTFVSSTAAPSYFIRIAAWRITRVFQVADRIFFAAQVSERFSVRPTREQELTSGKDVGCFGRLEE